MQQHKIPHGQGKGWFSSHQGGEKISSVYHYQTPGYSKGYSKGVAKLEKWS